MTAPRRPDLNSAPRWPAAGLDLRHGWIDGSSGGRPILSGRSRPGPRHPSASALVALLVALVLSLAAGGCRHDPPKPAGEPGTVDVTVAGKPFRLWVAATAQAREYGLMNRPSMPADRGMLFVFRREEPMGFWMSNTLIPLDIIYLDAGGRVVSIGHGRPMDRRTIPSGGPTQFVIELNDGAAAAAGLKVGDKIDLPKEAREPPGLE